MRRFLAPLIALIVVCHATAAIAQTSCPVPTIVQTGGTNPSCAGQPVTLDAGSGWATYQWSNGATTQTITDAPDATTSYVVTVTDANACSQTSNPLTINVNPAQSASIGVDRTPLCPDAWDFAQLSAPASGSWSDVQWSITNGSIQPSYPGAPNTSVQFRSDPSGQPVTLTAVATDENLCQTTTSVTIPVRTIPTPTIGVDRTPLCPGAWDFAELGAPASGSWSDVQWTITNGYIQPPYNGAPFTSVQFRSDPNGQPVTLTVVATDDGMCQTTASVTIPVRTIPTPTITVDRTPLCPGAWDFAQLSAPAEGSWSDVQWSITNGYIQPAYPGAPFTSVQFRSDPNGQPVTLTVVATDDGMCQTTASVTIPVRTIPTPTITVDRTPLCPGAWDFAQLNAPAEGSWSDVQWTITNGYIMPTYPGAPSTSVQFRSDPNGQPATLTVVAIDDGMCQTTASVTIPVRTISTPTISLDQSSMCPYAVNIATLPPPAEGSWADVQWSITNGTINPPNPWDPPARTTITFLSSPTGQPVTLTAVATDEGMCQTTASVTIPVRTITPPALTLDRTSMCPGSWDFASVAPPESGSWDSIQWTITNGTITSQPWPYPWSPMTSVAFYADNSGQPVTITATVFTGGYCTATSSATVSIISGVTPQIHVDSPICAGSPADQSFASIDPPAGGGWWGSVQWTITNGTLISNNGSRALFAPDFSGQPITFHVDATTGDGCSGSADLTVPVSFSERPVINVSPSAICAGPQNVVTATVQQPANGTWASYYWSVTNGTLTSPPSDSSVTFIVDGTADPTVFIQTTTEAGCINYNAITVPLVSVPQPQISTADRICAGTNGTAAISNASSYNSISWLIGGGVIIGPANGPSIQFAPTDNNQQVFLTANVTTEQGCAAQQSRTVSVVSSSASVSASGPTTFCAGGSVTLTANSGASYLWSNGASTQSIIGTAQSIVVTQSGSYSVTVTSADGCAVTSAATNVTVNPLPGATISASGPTTFCAGGSVTLTASSGASYLWSNGATTQSIDVTASGTFSVTVSNAQGCSATSSPTTVTVNPLPDATITPSGSTYFCEGGSVTLTAASNASYLWSTGATTQSINVVSSGVYTVTVTNEAGCSNTSQQWYVIANPLPTPTITADGPTTFCAGGTVHLTASPGDSYLWSNGATTRTIYTAQAGDYRVTVTTNGCSGTSTPTTVTVVPHPVVTITADGPTVFCIGGSVTLTASAGSSYLWSTGATTRSITVTQNGPVSVSVTDQYGCTGMDVVYVNVFTPTATITANGPTTFCAGGQVMLTANSGSAYHWSDGHTTPYIVVAQSGTYTVTVTDIHGCSTTSAPVDVIVNAGPSSIYFDTPDALNGAGTGGVQYCANVTPEITAHVTNAVSYSWSNGETGLLLHPTQNGTYTFTATSANGCSLQASVNVNFVPAPKPVIVMDGPTAYCGMVSMHVDTAGAPGGTTIYQWEIDPLISPPQGQTYTSWHTETVRVRAYYANGCSALSDPVSVTRLPDPNVTIVSNPAKLCPGGTVTLTASGGDAGTTYLWSNGATTQSITVNATSFYMVTATGTNGCSITQYYQLNGDTPPVPTIVVTGRTTLCPGESTTLTSYNAVGTYLWSNGATTQSITVSTPGDYTVTVTDDNGCSGTSSAVHITAGTLPTPAITANGPTTFCAGGTIILTASPSGTYLWSTGSTSQSIFVGTSGTYSVRVTNASGCSATSEATQVTVNALPATPVITAGGATTFCAGGSVTLTAPSSYAYSWSNGATTQSINVTAGGDYTVTVSNASGCTATSAATHVTVNPSPATPVITAGGATTFCAGGSVTLTASAANSYLWSNGATTQSIVVTTGGDYTVTVSNANGCTAQSATTTVTVNANPSAPVITPSGATTFCAGGSVTLTAPASSSYAWSNGATTQSIVVTATGDYSVIVSNGSGCTATSAATHVTVNANPATPVITAGGATTFCAGGSVTLTAPASSSYAWSNGATTQSIVVTATGDYSVTVSNGSGCTATSAATHVTVNANPTTPVITPSGTTTFCAGGSVTLTAPASSSYAWSNGATTQSINVTATGDYSVIVSNGSGCTATSAATHVTVNANPTTPVITAGGPTTFCAGGSVTLTAPSGYSYSWSNNATTQSIVVTATGDYTVTVSNGTCTAQSAATHVTVNAKPPVPVITPSGATTFCAGGSVTLTAPSGYSYSWSNNATTQSIVVTTSGDYTVTVSNGTCTAQSAATHVTVNASPATPTITPSGSTAICPGSSVTLTAPAGFTYHWSTNATSQSINVTSAGNYTVTVTNGSGCSATSAATAVTLKTTTSLTQPSNITIARNVTGTLSVSASGTNLTYQWYSGAAGNTGTPLGTSATQSVGPYKTKGTNSFWVRVTGDCGVASSATVTVTVN